MRLRATVEFVPHPDSYPPGYTAAEMAAVELAALQRWARGVGGVLHADVVVVGPLTPNDEELAVCDAAEPTDLVHGFGSGEVRR